MSNIKQRITSPLEREVANKSTMGGDPRKGSTSSIWSQSRLRADLGIPNRSIRNYDDNQVVKVDGSSSSTSTPLTLNFRTWKEPSRVKCLFPWSHNTILRRGSWECPAIPPLSTSLLPPSILHLQSKAKVFGSVIINITFSVLMSGALRLTRRKYTQHTYRSTS